MGEVGVIIARASAKYHREFNKKESTVTEKVHRKPHMKKNNTEEGKQSEGKVFVKLMEGKDQDKDYKERQSQCQCCLGSDEV